MNEEKSKGEALRDELATTLLECVKWRGEDGQLPHPGHLMAAIRYIKDQGVPLATRTGRLAKLEKALEDIPDYEAEDRERDRRAG
jgi:hypothetical protein